MRNRVRRLSAPSRTVLNAVVAAVQCGRVRSSLVCPSWMRHFTRCDPWPGIPPLEPSSASVTGPVPSYIISSSERARPSTPATSSSRAQAADDGPGVPLNLREHVHDDALRAHPRRVRRDRDQHKVHSACAPRPAHVLTLAARQQQPPVLVGPLRFHAQRDRRQLCADPRANAERDERAGAAADPGDDRLRGACRPRLVSPELA
jgi:hypothetical protein